MRFTIRHILIAVAVIALLLTVWSQAKYHYFDHKGDGPNTKRLEAALRSVNETDPSSDVTRRINEGDFRFAGCWGEPGGPYFPGVPQAEWQSIYDAKNYGAFAGTTDRIESRHHERLMDRAWQYAERFNLDLRTRSQGK